MKDIILSEKQLETLVTKMKTIKENDGGKSYMAKQQLYTISKMAEKMWEKMEDEGDDEELDDWMESKIAQAEQSISSVVNAYMYNELTDSDEIGGMNKLGYDDLIIGK